MHLEHGSSLSVDQQLRRVLQPEVFHPAAELCVPQPDLRRRVHLCVPLFLPRLVRHAQPHRVHPEADFMCCHQHVNDRCPSPDRDADELHQVPHEARLRELHDNREPGARGGRQEQVRHRAPPELGAGLRLQRLDVVAPDAHAGVPPHRRRRPVARALHPRHRRGRGAAGGRRRCAGSAPAAVSPRPGGGGAAPRGGIRRARRRPCWPGGRRTPRPRPGG
mmetsp:Transcript_126576/g.357982  ORF Transcript_126576/g.357982 Transcript_126576/m.357982 type:complete len:220 (-) Transcript_126576:17-676(-)